MGDRYIGDMKKKAVYMQFILLCYLGSGLDAIYIYIKN